MFIWLPPSESKTAPAEGPKFDPGSLSRAALSQQRRELTGALMRLGDDEEAARALGLGPKSAAQASANRRLLDSPCAPAREVFTGVLYDALGLPRLDERRGAAADRSILIFSGLFGVLSTADPIPDHRLPVGARLPGYGPLAAFWRAPLGAVLREEAEGECVVDARSGGYAAMCRAPWAHLITIGAVRESGGVRRAVSHDAKRWRGLACRELLALDPGAGVDEVLESLSSMAGRVSISDAGGALHRVVDVEIGEAPPIRGGGSTRAVVLVTD